MPTVPSPPASVPPLARARVVGPYARTAVDAARELGADLAQLGEACGLPDLAHGLPESLPVPTYIELLAAAAEQLEEPLFGLKVGERMRLPTFAGYGLVLCTCADFRSAAEQTRRFESLAHDLGRSEIVEAGAVAHYRWHSPWLDQPGARHLAESVMAGIRTFANWLAGQPLPVIDVAFTHPMPPHATLQAYEEALGGPVRFDAAVIEARFPAAVLDAPVGNADTSLFTALERTAEERLAERERETREPALVQAVRQRIRAQLMHDRAGLADVAREMGFSERSLQRRLALEGASFSMLLDTTRRELAQQYLRDPRLSLTEISFLLAFNQQSSFTHAFRAWFGTTPAAWRDAQQRLAPAAAAEPPPTGS